MKPVSGNETDGGISDEPAFDKNPMPERTNQPIPSEKSNEERVLVQGYEASTPPTAAKLQSKGYGKPSKNHSFTQEASFETVLFQVLKVGSRYLTKEDQLSLCGTHPLINHLHQMIGYYSKVDFSKLREYDPNYATQKEIPSARIEMFMACLFFYDLRVANVMRYVGNNYTAEYRNVTKMIERIRGLVDDDLIGHYIRVMTVGAPAHFNYECTRENALLHLRQGNHPSIALNLPKVQKAMNKMEQHSFVIPFNSWIARFVPHIFFTPQHMLESGRLIFDASKRFTPTSIPVNRMTSTKMGVELNCDYGKVLLRLLTRIWNLRITYLFLDIILHANDVKSCFRQMKHHPDIMGAFSYIVADILYLSCGLTFGSDFSPQTWEVPRRMAEQLATNLFKTKGLEEKHRQHLDKLTWSKKLGKRANFTQAHKSITHQGVLDKNGEPSDTPHHLFVDDDVYADVYDVDRVEQTVACGIEALFRLLGESDLSKRLDPVSWDKLLDMVIHFRNKILGIIIDTRKMTVEVPPEYIKKIVKLIDDHWYQGHRTFEVNEAEKLAGQLTHIANTAPWLRHMLLHVYISISAGLKSNEKKLRSTSKLFRDQLKIAKANAMDEKGVMEQTFAQAETARKTHKSKNPNKILPTLREELNLIRQALADERINKCYPIAHLISNEADADADGDSSLDAAGGFSVSMRFWWHHEWSEKIRKRTLRYVKDGKDGTLIDINALEYATILINYAACIHFWIINNNCSRKNIPFPRVLIRADNKSAESWAIKGCKRLMIGRRLGRLQCALMINNPVGIDTEYINTKANVIPDRISQFKLKTDTLLGFDILMQEYPQLKSCRRFQPSKELISWISDALLSEKLEDPLALSQELLSNPGRIIS